MADPVAAAAAPLWWRLEMAVPPELEDSLLWKLESLGIRRVAVRHRPGAPAERRLQAWLPAVDWPPQQRLQLAGLLAGLGEPFGLPPQPLQWFEQDDEDWSLSWKRHWQPDPVGERLLILPAWLSVPPEHAQRLLIRLDPGSAFGTGAHPTTRLCLEALERLAAERGGALAGLRVADLGCGSGVLALAALKLGADGVTAVDLDPLAETATRHNASLNGVELAGRLQVGRGSIETLAELQPARADLLLCNILAPVIEALAPAFETVLAPGGVGFLSGLLVEQAPRLEHVLAEAGWRAQLTHRQENWGLMSLKRPGAVA
ncbi:MAG: 50S ribosomal protein L11 methyltransferase [Cyanobium sp.]